MPFYCLCVDTSLRVRTCETPSRALTALADAATPSTAPLARSWHPSLPQLSNHSFSKSLSRVQHVQCPSRNHLAPVSRLPSRGFCCSTAATHLCHVVLFIGRSGGRALGPRRRHSLCCKVPHIPMAWTMCHRQRQLYSIQMRCCFLLGQKNDRGEEIRLCDNCDCDTPSICFLRPTDHTFLSEFYMFCLGPPLLIYQSYPPLVPVHSLFR